VLVPRRTFQLETGYKSSRTTEAPGSLDVRVLPDLLARYGINKKVELRLAAAGWTIESGSTENATGFSDISLGTKIALADERGKRPQMGLLVDVSLPVGHSDLTSSYVLPKVVFLGANSLSDRMGLTYNLGPSLVTAGSDGESETNVELEYAVALSGAVGGPFSLFGELYGAFTFSSNLPDRHSFQAGTTILLSPLFQIDIRGGLGLVENEPDWLVGAGLAFRVPH
jgi:hypothetical protein